MLSSSSMVRVMPSTFDFVGNDSSMSQPGEDVRDLPDAVDRLAGLADRRQVVRAARLEGEVVAVRRPLVVPRLAVEGAGDDPTDGVLAGQDLPRDPATGVELVERDRLLVRGDLEHRVGRRVDDPLAGPLVLLAELLDDLRPGGGLVADHAAARAVHERVDDVVGKAVRVGGERRRRDDAHELPVARGRVLALRPLDETARDRRRVRLRWASLERLHVAEAERLEVRQVEAADRTGHVAERVRALVPEIAGVGQRARSDGVQDDHAGPRHSELS